MLGNPTFSNVRVHPDSSCLCRGIKRLVDVVFRIEKISPDVELDIFILSLSDMSQAHYSRKGRCCPTDALTFHESQVTRDVVHRLLFDGKMPFLADGMKENKMQEDFPSSTRGIPLTLSTVKDSKSSEVPEIGREGTRQFTALMNAKKYEKSRTARRCIGEIYLCPSYMLYRLQYFPLTSLPSFAMYMQAALIHALLHALGEDHEKPQELYRMIKKEQRIGMYLDLLAKRSPHFSPYSLFVSN